MSDINENKIEWEDEYRFYKYMKEHNIPFAVHEDGNVTITIKLELAERLIGGYLA